MTDSETTYHVYERIEAKDGTAFWRPEARITRPDSIAAYGAAYSRMTSIVRVSGRDAAMAEGPVSGASLIEVLKTCDACDGNGEFERMADRQPANPHDPPNWELVRCHTCGGEGEVFDDTENADDFFASIRLSNTPIAEVA